MPGLISNVESRAPGDIRGEAANQNYNKDRQPLPKRRCTIKVLTLKHGTPALWQGLPVLVVILIGGFTTNVTWCAALNIRNKTGHQYFRPWLQAPHPKPEQENILEAGIAAPTREMIERVPSS